MNKHAYETRTQAVGEGPFAGRIGRVYAYNSVPYRDFNHVGRNQIYFQISKGCFVAPVHDSPGESHAAVEVTASWEVPILRGSRHY